MVGSLYDTGVAVEWEDWGVAIVGGTVVCRAREREDGGERPVVLEGPGSLEESNETLETDRR